MTKVRDCEEDSSFTGINSFWISGAPAGELRMWQHENLKGQVL